MLSEEYLLPLLQLMQSLPNEERAVRAASSLSFFKADEVPELLEVVHDASCDHPDDDPSWVKAGKYHAAGSANRKLAEKLVELAPEYLEQHSLQLLNRRSSKFKIVTLEFLLEKKCQPLDHFLGLALAEPDDHQRRNYLWQFKLGLVRANLSLEQRDKLFDMLLPMLQLRQEQLNKIDYCELINTLHAERASQYFSSIYPIDPNSPLLLIILRHPGFLRSTHCFEELRRLFDFFTDESNICKNERHESLRCIVNAARAKQSRELQPILEKCAARPEPDLRRISLKGLVDLKLPHAPARKALELVESKRRLKLTQPVRLIGYAALYLENFNTHSVLEFAESAKASEYIGCMEALGELQAWEHLALLTDVRDELGDDPRRALRHMKEGARQRLSKKYSERAKQLEMEEIEESIHRYVLAHETEFRAIRELESD